MRKKLFARLAAAAFVQVLFPVPALAAIVVSEVMYDPAGTDTGREWVEIWNDSGADFDLGAAFLLENGANHKIAPFGGASAIVPAGGYAIVADKPESFLVDYPNVGPVFDSAFSLSNSGERAALVDADGDEFSSADWDASSGATDGKSWQRSGTSWLAAPATPGSRNADREESPAAALSTSPAQTAAAISAHSGTGGLTRVSRESALEVDAGRDRVVPVGAELSIEPEIEGAARASYSWVWGDGASSRGRRGRHTYRFPGTYAVVLNAKGAGGSVATSRSTVVVVEPSVSLAVTLGDDGAVAILSRSPNELNLGGFRLDVDGESFEIPQDTILLPSGRIDVPNALSELFLEGGGASSAAAVTLRRPDGRPVPVAG